MPVPLDLFHSVQTLTPEFIPPLHLTQLAWEQDEATLTAYGRGFQDVTHSLRLRTTVTLFRDSRDQTLWFGWIVDVEQNEPLSPTARPVVIDSFSVPFPGPYYQGDGGFMEVAYDHGNPINPLPDHGTLTARFDGQRVKFSGFGIPSLVTSNGGISRRVGTFYLHTNATMFVRGGRIRYFRQGGSLQGTEGTLSSLVPLTVDPKKVEEQFRVPDGGLPKFTLPGLAPTSPPRNEFSQRLAELANLHQAATAWASPALAETIHREVQQELAALSRLRSDKKTEAS